MGEMQKIWLKELYKGEIENEMATLANERIWENGIADGEYNPHTENIREHEKYIEMLKELLEGVDKCDII